MLSALDQLSSHIHDLKFGDLLQALMDRGLNERAKKYENEVTVECFLRGVDNPLELTIRDIIRIYTTIPDPMFGVGWDNAYRGPAYYGRNRSV